MTTPTFDIYVRETGQRHRVHFSGQSALKRGGAGSVWRMPSGRFSGNVVKLYHDPKQSANRTKLGAMLSRPPGDVYLNVAGKRLVQFAWPTHLVEDASGQCVGFLMPEVDGNAPRLLVYNELREAQRRLTPEQRSLHGRIQVAANISTLMASLHELGHSFIDVKDENVLIYPDVGSAAFIDCDGFRIDDGHGRIYPAELATPEYSSPEYARGSHPEQLDEMHDRFALAIILFKLLNYGVHPFQGRPVSQRLLSRNSFGTVECIGERLYPYGARRNDEIEPIRRSIHETWDTSTRALFDRAFTAERPEQRPRASEWARHLRSILSEKGLARCETAPQDVEHLHFANRPCHVCTILSVGAAAISGAGRSSVSSATGARSAGLSRSPNGTTPLSGNTANASTTNASTRSTNTVGSTSPAPSSNLPPVSSSGSNSGAWWIVGIIAVIALLAFFANSKDGGSAGSAVPSATSSTSAASPILPPPLPPFGPESSASDIETSPAFVNAERVIASEALGKSFISTASSDFEETLNSAVGGDVSAIRVQAIAVNRGVAVPAINGLIDSEQLAPRFNQAGKRAFWEAHDQVAAIRLAKVAFGIEPTNREYASNLAQYFVEAGDLKSGLPILLLSTVLPRPDGAAPRIQDWETFATIAAQLKETAYANNALYVAYAIAANVKTRCESMLRYPKTRPQLESAAKEVFGRIQQRMAQGEAPFEPACVEPLQWERP